MNKIQYLLVDLMEELSEVQKELSKCIKFTPEHRPDCYETTNFERLRLEIADVWAVLGILLEEGMDLSIEDNPSCYKKFKEKRGRIKEHMQISKNLGMLHE